MKPFILALCLLPATLSAQKEFPQVWEGKFTVDAKWKVITPDLDYVIGGDLTELEMLDGTTGKPLWTYNIKEKHGVKKCEDWVTHHETETIEVIVQPGGKKDAPRESVFLDYRTGQVVSQAQLAPRLKEKN